MKRWLRSGAWVAAACLTLACGPATSNAPPNLVLVVIDTARGDRFSLYGHDRPTSPRLDALAKESIVFDNAFASSCWTVASHASLFTGLLPATHQATQEHLRLDESLETLAELVSGAGYETAAFSNNSWVSEATDLVRGFDHVAPMWKESSSPVTPHPTNRAVLTWLAERDPSRPYLLFVNYIEPHWPYQPEAAMRERFAPGVGESLRRRSDFPAIQWYLRRKPPPPRVLEARSALYDAEVATADAVLGDLVDALRSGGFLDQALLVVTSDHGENLGEHGHQGHSFSLHDTTLRIPLLIRPPGGGGGGRRADPVQLPDVFATLAAAAGTRPRDARVVGSDLLAGVLPFDRPIVAEYYTPETFLRRFPDTPRGDAVRAAHQRRLRAIRVGDRKLIWASDGTRELYDTKNDPGETTDLAAQEPERARALTERLDALLEPLLREPAALVPPELDDETEAHLRALGYL